MKPGASRRKDLTIDYLSVTRVDGFVQVSARLLVEGEPAEVTIRRFGRLMENVALGRRRGGRRRAP